MVKMLINLSKEEDKIVSHKKIDYGVESKSLAVRQIIREAVKRQSKGKTLLKLK